MRVQIIHLSDMHFTGNSDALLARASRVAQAINSRSVGIDHAIMLLTGDVAFSGKALEYEAAKDFLLRVLAELNLKPLVAVVPGNHDCDFSGDQAARDLMIESIAKRESLEVAEPSIVVQCTSAQDSFFAFRDLIATHGLKYNHDRLSYEYSVGAGDDAITIYCYNTAWVSKRLESQGTLVYPISLVKPRVAGFSIAAFHHPYNWLSASIAKPFRRAIEAHVDVVFTGHEHESDQALNSRPLVQTTTSYIEGGALQISGDSSESSFNVLILDTKLNEQKFIQFFWDGDIYRPAKEVESWEPLALNLHRFDHPFEIEHSFREWLDDPGLPSARGQGQRSFNDFFLYPDLVESVKNADLSRPRRTIKSATVFDTVSKLGITFASAPPKSGRTALARRLFYDFYQTGFVPVYINAADGGLRPNGEIAPVILRNASKQYGDGSLERYRQLEKNLRVLIVDNVESLKLNTSSIVALIAEMRAFAGNVILLGDNTIGRMVELSSIVDADDQNNVFDVQPLGSALRERFAQQWFASAKNAEEADDSQLTTRLRDVERTLNTIMGKNNVPAYPFYIISVLQAFEDGSSVDMRASTHGYFYELIIRIALTSGGSTRDTNVRLA